jgi:hypothetical protein
MGVQAVHLIRTQHGWGSRIVGSEEGLQKIFALTPTVF